VINSVALLSARPDYCFAAAGEQKHIYTGANLSVIHTSTFFQITSPVGLINIVCDTTSAGNFAGI